MNSIISSIGSAYSRATLCVFGLLFAPAAAMAQSKVWNLGNDSSLANVNKKLDTVGMIIMNSFRIVMLLLLIWRIIAFVREKKAMDLIFCIIAAVLIGFAEEIVIGFMTFGAK